MALGHTYRYFNSCFIGSTGSCSQNRNTEDHTPASTFDGLDGYFAVSLGLTVEVDRIGLSINLIGRTCSIENIVWE